MLERLKEIKRTATYPLSQEAADALEKIDREMEAQMLHAEKKCQKFYANHYEFSPTVKKWLDRCHSYRALIRLKLKMEQCQQFNSFILSNFLSKLPIKGFYIRHVLQQAEQRRGNGHKDSSCLYIRTTRTEFPLCIKSSHDERAYLVLFFRRLLNR